MKKRFIFLCIVTALVTLPLMAQHTQREIRREIFKIFDEDNNTWLGIQLRDLSAT